MSLKKEILKARSKGRAEQKKRAIEIMKQKKAKERAETKKSREMAEKDFPYWVEKLKKEAKKYPNTKSYNLQTNNDVAYNRRIRELFREEDISCYIIKERPNYSDDYGRITEYYFRITIEG